MISSLKVILLAFSIVYVKAQCEAGVKKSLGRNCSKYLVRCPNGTLRLISCSDGYFYDRNSERCLKGEVVECRSIVNFKSRVKKQFGDKIVYHIKNDKSLPENRLKSDRPILKTKSSYWTEIDGNEIADTNGPGQTVTSKANYWTGTDSEGMTGTEWPSETVTTEGNYWTGTDAKGMTGTEWPSQTVTTEGNYWTGTDAKGMTGTEWPSENVTTEGNYWTGTASKGMTGTERPGPTVTTEVSYPSKSSNTWPVNISTSTWWTVTEKINTDVSGYSTDITWPTFTESPIFTSDIKTQTFKFTDTSMTEAAITSETESPIFPSSSTTTAKQTDRTTTTQTTTKKSKMTTRPTVLSTKRTTKRTRATSRQTSPTTTRPNNHYVTATEFSPSSSSSNYYYDVFYDYEDLTTVKPNAQNSTSLVSSSHNNHVKYQVYIWYISIIAFCMYSNNFC